MPRKLGQHFLRDRSVLSAIVEALDLTPADNVLEIGPGEGVLTRQLLAAGAEVTAVELDSKLAARLREDASANLRIVEADALEIEPAELMPQPYKLAGNIPYYITGALIRKYLSTPAKPTRAVLMVQLEVARRIVAGPGEMSLLSVAVQFHARASFVTRVSRRSFSPPPQVDSGVVKLELLPRPSVDAPDDATFFTVVRAGFGTKRKQLANAISHGLDLPKTTTVELLTKAKVNPMRRAEDLDLSDWGRLSWAVYNLDEQRRLQNNPDANGRPTDTEDTEP